MLPAFDVRDLDLPAAVEALRLHRCVLFRQVFPPVWLARLAERAETAFALRQAQHTQGTLPAWLAHHYHRDHVPFLDLQSLDSSGGPPLEVLAGFFQTLLPLLVQAYWQGPFLINLASSVVRQQSPLHPERYTPWHQDGFFMDTRLPALNVWVPLTDCGQHSPGLELVLGAWAGLLPTAAQGEVRGDYAQMQIAEEHLPMRDRVRPLLRVGDLLIFDHLIPHRTHAQPQMTTGRTSLEIRLIPGVSPPPEYAALPYVTDQGHIHISS